MNAKEFFAKAKGTKLEKEIVILFNLYCVYKDIRPAYLHYSRSKEISTKSQTEVIKKGDIIEFKCGQESFRIGVKDVKVFDTFLQALKSCTLKKTLPGINTYAEGVEIYHSISNYKENEKKYGVCAIILDNI